MKFRHLRIFETVTRHGNLTRAARALSMTQPAVSTCLRQLEQDFGQKFFQRTNRGVELTPVGGKFLESVRPLLTQLDRLERSFLTTERPAQADRLVIGGSNTLSVTTLPEVIVAFKAAYPHASIELVTNHGHQIEKGVAERRIDIGLITAIPGNNKSCTYEPYKEHEAIAFVSPAHPLCGKTIDLAELGRHTLVARRGSTSIAEIQKKGHTLNFALLCDDPESVKMVVSKGTSVGILFRTRVDFEISIGELCRVHVPDLKEVKTQSFIIYQANAPLSETGCAFLDLLKSMRSRLP